jgi:subtilase family serine protease
MSFDVRACALAGAMISLACLPSSADASTSWVNTATQAIPLVGAVSLGALAPATSVRITVALQMQNEAALKSLVQAQNTPGSASFGKFITPGQFNKTYAPSVAAVDLVSKYLQKSGLGSITVTPNHLFISAVGTAAQVSTAFHTSLGAFTQNGATIYANTKPAQIPSTLQGIVISVLGLNNVSANHKLVTPCTVTSPTCVRLEYDPSTYWAAYNVNKIPAATNTSIAVMAEGDVSGVVTDLRAFETAMSLPQVPVTVEHVGIWSPDTSGADEWDLDTQYTTGMAGNVKNLYIYATTSLSDQDTALEFNRWVTDDLAQVANASFSICEFFPYLDGTMVADDQVFLQGAAQGQTLFSATGDTGSFCSVGTPNGVPAGAPFVGYPASSTYVVAVGGTSLLTNTDGSYKAEISWYAGGGGLSQFEGPGYWQSNISPSDNPNSPEIFRSIPDVSMDADANTGAIIYYDGASEVVGGTSLASPLAVGAWARVMSFSHNKPGFAPPNLYANYPVTGTPPITSVGLTEEVDGFHDILTGADGLYTALPYYDFTTGLGTFDVAKKTVAVHALQAQ